MTEEVTKADQQAAARFVCGIDSAVLNMDQFEKLIVAFASHRQAAHDAAVEEARDLLNEAAQIVENLPFDRDGEISVRDCNSAADRIRNLASKGEKR